MHFIYILLHVTSFLSCKRDLYLKFRALGIAIQWKIQYYIHKHELSFLLVINVCDLSFSLMVLHIYLQ